MIGRTRRCRRRLRRVWHLLSGTQLVPVPVPVPVGRFGLRGEEGCGCGGLGTELSLPSRDELQFLGRTCMPWKNVSHELLFELNFYSVQLFAVKRCSACVTSEWVRPARCLLRRCKTLASCSYHRILTKARRVTDIISHRRNSEYFYRRRRAALAAYVIGQHIALCLSELRWARALPCLP